MHSPKQECPSSLKYMFDSIRKGNSRLVLDKHYVKAFVPLHKALNIFFYATTRDMTLR